MATMDVTTELRLTELRKRSLRKTFDHIEAQSSSVLFLSLQWKDIEEHFDSITKSISQRHKEVTSLEESIIKRFDEIQLREQGVDSVQESVNQRFKELELREKSFEKKERLVFEEQSKELNLLRVSVEEQSREVEMVQRTVKEGLKSLQLKKKKIVMLQESVEEQSKEVEVVQNSIKGSFRDLELKERQLSLIEKSVEDRVKDNDLKERLIEMYSKELKLNEKRLEERAKEHELKVKRFEEYEQAFALKEKRLEERFVEIELKGKRFEERAKEVELKEMRFEERYIEIELKEKRLEERYREVELKGKILEQCSKEVELKEKESEEWSRDIEAKGQGFTEDFYSKVQSEAFETLVGNNAIVVYAPKHVRLCEIMDGNSLQMFLNKHCEEHDLMPDEVLYALSEASDPAKLVLDAMQGFYPLNADNGNTSIELNVVRKSCILLLEQLMRLSPEITPIVKGEATTLAFDWMTKMSPKAENHMELLGFFLLLAAFGLAAAFDEDELVSQLVVVARDRQGPELCRLLGLAPDKISDIILILIARKQHLDAIRFVYAFKLVGDFQPVRLLKQYMKLSEEAARKICRMQNYSPAAQIEAFNKRVADLKAVIRCIEDHNLESEVPPKNLECSITELEKKAANIKTFPSSVPKPQPQQHCEKTCIIVAPPVPLQIIAPTFEPTPNVQEGQEHGNKRIRTALSATDAFNASLGATSSIYSVAFHNQKPSGIYTDQEFIQNLIEKEERIEAVRYVCAFGLHDKFPPAALLKDYLSHSKKVADKILEDGKNSLEAQICSIRKEIAAYKCVLLQIANFKLESEYPPKILEDRIVQLEKQREDMLKVVTERKKDVKVLNSKGRGGPVTRSKSKVMKNQSEKKETASTTGTPAAPAAQPLQLSGRKRRRVSESPKAAHPNLHSNHGVQYSTRHYSSAGLPPSNQLTGSYPNIPFSYYPGVGYYHGVPAGPYGGPCNTVNGPGYNDRPSSSGGHGDGRGPSYRDGQTHYGSYDLPPQRHSSLNP